MADKKGVANFVRRTWDKAHYARLAEMRANGQLEDTNNRSKKPINRAKEEFKTADEDAAGPAGSSRAFLKARTEKLTFDSGTIKVIKADDIAKSGGNYCEVCDTTLKDSVAYLDHINGKRHLKRLGFSMRVERSSVNDVKNRLKNAAKRKWDPELSKKLDAMEEYEKKLKLAKEQEEAKKKKKKKTNKTKTTDKEQEQEQEQQQEQEQEQEQDKEQKVVEEDKEEEQDEMMKLMGFSGFHTSKK